MTIIHLKGRITEDGTLEVELPPELPIGEVDIALTMESQQDTEVPWTEDEINDYLNFQENMGKEIVDSDAFGSWSQLGIEDSLEWIEQKRRERRQRRRSE